MISQTLFKTTRTVVHFAIVLVLFGVMLNSCKSQGRVYVGSMAEYNNDFVFENEFIAGRISGMIEEEDMISPGIDVIVKTPGVLLLEELYEKSLDDLDVLNDDSPQIRDIYKMYISLGGGASAPYYEDKLVFPASNYTEYEIIEQKADKAVFVIRYPAWQVGDKMVSLDKKITVVADSYFCLVEDSYKFEGNSAGSTPTLAVAAGLFRHPHQHSIQEEYSTPEIYAIWENSTHEKAEESDGKLGLAIIVPDAESAVITPYCTHGIRTKTIKSGEVFRYYFGSCWSKGDIKTAEGWFDKVSSQYKQ